MKHPLYLLLAVVYHFSSYSQPVTPNHTFFLKGKIDGKDSGVVYLTYTDTNQNSVSDSAELENGEFSFRGFIAEPTYAYFRVSRNDYFNSKSMFIEPASISATFKINDFENAKISGSHTQDEREELNKTKMAFSKPMKDLNRALAENIQELNKDGKNKKLLKANKKIAGKLAPYHKKMLGFDLEFISVHPNSYLSAYLLREALVDDYPIVKVSQLYNSFSPEIKASVYGKFIEGAITGIPGNKAQDFSTTDIDENPVSLSTFKGKSYVLLDFWATWCGPCRANSPHLIQLYNKYHIKGLEIIGIANDDQRVAAWKLAIEQDKTEIFYQVLQRARTKNDIGALFGISSIPTKILIDKEGQIVFKHVGNRDKSLDRKLAEIFKK